MYSGGQRKGYSRWNIGPETEPQLKQLYHGLGGEPVYHYAGNPVSWLVTLANCIPFIHLKQDESDQPIDQAVADDVLSSFSSGGPMEDTGSNFTSDPGGLGYLTPAAIPGLAAPTQTLSPAGVPMGTIKGKIVPLYGSRKTYTGG